MNLINKHPWVLYHQLALKRFLRSIWSSRTLLLLYFSVMSLAISFFHLLGAWRALSLDSPPVNTISAVFTYAELVILIKIFQWLTAMLTITILPIWAFAGFFSFIVTRFVNDGVFQLFLNEPPDFVYHRTRFLHVVEKAIRPRYKYVLVPCMLFVLILYVMIGIGELPLHQVVDIYSWTMLAFVPIVWFIGWASFYMIYHKGRHQRLCLEYFFSESAIKRGFKSTVDALIWLAILGWFVIPALINTVDVIAYTSARILTKTHNYSDKWEFLLKGGYPADSILVNSFVDLPNPSILPKRISPIGDKLTLADVRPELQNFQNGMFTLVTFAGLLSIGLPSIGGAWLVRGRQKAIRTALIATLKSGLFTVLIQVFITKAYFIDANNPFGLAAIFMFLLSFFLSIDVERKTGNQ